MGYIKLFFSIKTTVIFLETEAASWYKADTAPLAVSHLKNLSDCVLCRTVAFTAHHPPVSIHDLRTPFLQHLYSFQNPCQQINGFETGWHNWNMKLPGNRFVLLITHNGTNMSGSQKPLNPIFR